ncbi:hypothetical protein SAMN05192553_106156 [Cyclobacterium xiamenense]|uniref:Uncharacterized protein n=1 Tax=Cyclobacterium xiamenense TaxID=1297121 RepID=A0A1H7AB04_9BACT|nr:hypothetical protein [Cyclobacterium xiamenense]SEJ62588.1 hypothetical protein SAMN05192553_106156 [Cyclobacterium xiamenense]
MKAKSAALLFAMLLLTGIAAIAFFTSNGATNDKSQPEGLPEASFKPGSPASLTPIHQADQVTVDAPNPPPVPVREHPYEGLQIRFDAFGARGVRKTAFAVHAMARLRLILFPYHFFY